MSREENTGNWPMICSDAPQASRTQLEAQWKILGAKYVAIAGQSPEADERNTFSIRSKANC